MRPQMLDRAAVGRRIERRWGDLSAVELQPTLETLHLWSQVVGKIRMMLTPWVNHSWHVTLYLSARGLTTGMIPACELSFSMEFDLVHDLLLIQATDGSEISTPLKRQSNALFHDRVLDAVRSLGISVSIDPVPCEIPGAIAFDQDHAERIYSGEAARAYWRAMVEVERVFQTFRTRFTGKCSPVHLFWGAFDLAVTRFSGRPAPRHPGGAPHMPNSVAREAYSQEVSSAGFWPGDASTSGPSFYSYAYPAPPGFADTSVGPTGARFDAALGEFLLPYSAVIAADDPDAALLQFLQDTYEAAAELAGWNRATLERAEGPLGHPPEGS